jgi:hypothetical protein
MHTTPTPTDPAKHLVLDHAHDLSAPPDRVFPLLCPVREYEWISDWRCELIHTTSGVVEKGCVFLLDYPPELRTVWVTSVHDPANHTLEFVRVSGERLVTIMALRVEPRGAGSRLHIRYTLVAIDAAGQTIVDHARATGEPHAEVARGIARKLEHFLTTGRVLTEAAPAR